MTSAYWVGVLVLFAGCAHQKSLADTRNERCRLVMEILYSSDVAKELAEGCAKKPAHVVTEEAPEFAAPHWPSGSEGKCVDEIFDVVDEATVKPDEEGIRVSFFIEDEVVQFWTESSRLNLPKRQGSIGLCGADGAALEYRDGAWHVRRRSP